MNADPQAQRILVIDDNPAIHDDFRKIFASDTESETDLSQTEAALFREAVCPDRRIPFQIDSAFQGQEGLALVEKAGKEDRPYAMAFVDVRMPPGWDGIETTVKLWEIDPEIQIVICTAYSDYSWDEMVAKLPRPDQLLILKKPFDAVEVLQLGHALTEKWRLQQAVKFRINHLEMHVDARTRVLEAEVARLKTENQHLTEALRNPKLSAN